MICPESATTLSPTLMKDTCPGRDIPRTLDESAAVTVSERFDSVVPCSYRTPTMV